MKSSMHHHASAALVAYQFKRANRDNLDEQLIEDYRRLRAQSIGLRQLLAERGFKFEGAHQSNENVLFTFNAMPQPWINIYREESPPPPKKIRINY